MKRFQEYLYYFSKKRSEKNHRDYYKAYLAAARTCDCRKSEAMIRSECRQLVGRTADTRETFDAHPTMGFRFDGALLPRWKEVEAFAVSVSEKYAPIKYVGWDVFFPKKGSFLIEGNNGSNIEIMQYLYGGVKSLFGIGSPDAYWYASNYSLKNL